MAFVLIENRENLMKGSFKLLFFLLQIMPIFYVVAQNPKEAKKVKKSRISCTIAMKTLKEPIIVITFKNEDTERVLIEPRHIFRNGKIRANNFDIRLNNKKVSYIGKMIKRRPTNPNEYVFISPNKHISFEVNLTQSYKFEDQFGLLKIQYSSFNVVNDGKKVSIEEIVSNIVEVELKEK